MKIKNFNNYYEFIIFSLKQTFISQKNFVIFKSNVISNLIIVKLLHHSIVSSKV